VFDENVHDLSLFHICGSLIMAYSFHDELTVKPSTSSEKDDNGHDNDSDSEDGDEDEEPQSIIAMVPMADMLNHRTGFNNARLFHEPDCLQMRAIKDIKAQEQIYNTYGDLCNADLLRKYGFIDDPNEHDIVEISGDMVRDVCCPPDQTEDEKEAKVRKINGQAGWG
jgi:SET domain-containing protein 6